MASLKAAVFAAALAGLSAASAQAADALEPSTWNWAGPYLGINAGGASGSSNWTAGTLTTGPFPVSGIVAGATAGYNFTGGPLVFGIVGDIDWTNVAGSTSSHCGINCATSSDWLGTVRGRIGFPTGNFMPFVTAGLAVGDINAHFVDSSTGSADAVGVGWTAGAGAEVQLKDRWSVQGEVLYADLGSITCGLAVCTHTGTITTTVPLTEMMFRLGLNRHF
jgi:outer membrane immunogenic protein